MTWTAPEVERSGGSLVADEREMAQGFLQFHRTTFLMKCSGLTGEQLARRAASPSNISLLGLIRHLAKVERTWFRLRFAGEPIEPLYAGQDIDFDDLDPSCAEQEYRQLLNEWRLADAATAAASLDDTFIHAGNTYVLRLVYLHLIGEYARHNGHADMIRERLDGVIGA